MAEQVTEEETCESLDRKGVCSSCEEPIEDVKNLFRCRTCSSEPTTSNASAVPSFCQFCVVAHIRKRHEVSDYKGHEIIVCDKHRLNCDTFCDSCQTLMCSECCKGHPGDHEIVSVESKAVESTKKIHETISQHDADYKSLARAADNMRMRVDKEKFDTHNSLNALEVIGDLNSDIELLASTNSALCIVSRTSKTSVQLKFISEDGKTIEQANYETEEFGFVDLYSTQQFIVSKDDFLSRRTFKVEGEKVSVPGLHPSKFDKDYGGFVEIDGELHSFSLLYMEEKGIGTHLLTIRPEHPMFLSLSSPPHNFVLNLFHFDMGLVAVCSDIKSETTKIWLYPPMQDSVERPPRLLFTLSKPCGNELKMFDGTGFITLVAWVNFDPTIIDYVRFNTQTEVVDFQKTVTFNIGDMATMTVTKDSCYWCTLSGVLLKCKDLLKQLNDMV